MPRNLSDESGLSDFADIDLLRIRELITDPHEVRELCETWKLDGLFGDALNQK